MNAIFRSLGLLLLAMLPCLFMGCSQRKENSLAIYSARSESSAININTATVDQLEKLPGIGQKTAESIVSYRSENGPFRRVEHIMLIRGVSERRFLELKPFLIAE